MYVKPIATQMAKRTRRIRRGVLLSSEGRSFSAVPKTPARQINAEVGSRRNNKLHQVPVRDIPVKNKWTNCEERGEGGANTMAYLK